jgi:hypothetical protein
MVIQAFSLLYAVDMICTDQRSDTSRRIGSSEAPFAPNRHSLPFKSSAQPSFFLITAIPKNQRPVQSLQLTFVHNPTPSQPKTSISTPETLSFAQNSIVTPPSNFPSVHKLCRCSEGWR